jgi:hypothetical protein
MSDDLNCPINRVEVAIGGTLSVIDSREKYWDHSHKFSINQTLVPPDIVVDGLTVSLPSCIKKLNFYLPEGVGDTDIVVDFRTGRVQFVSAHLDITRDGDTLFVNYVTKRRLRNRHKRREQQLAAV